MDALLEWMVEPNKVLEVRQAAATPPPGKELLIQWKGLPAFEVFWEPAASIIQHFPQLHLEDKVVLETEDNDNSLSGSHTLEGPRKWVY